VGTENDQIVLESSELVPTQFDQRSFAEISAAWKTVRRYILQINGAAMQCRIPWTPISLVNMQVIKSDGKKMWFPITGSLEVYESPDVHAYKRTQSKNSRHSVEKPQATHPAASLLLASLKDEGIAKLLRLQERQHDWMNLYRIFEVIREDSGGDREIAAKGWATLGDINAFTGSANNASVSGDEARHGKLKGGAPKETMTLARARHFIAVLTDHWLAHKAARSVP